MKLSGNLVVEAPVAETRKKEVECSASTHLRSISSACNHQTAVLEGKHNQAAAEFLRDHVSSRDRKEGNVNTPVVDWGDHRPFGPHLRSFRSFTNSLRKRSRRAMHGHLHSPSTMTLACLLQSGSFPEYRRMIYASTLPKLNLNKTKYCWTIDTLRS